jgi:GT2 family glycosyltransferase
MVNNNPSVLISIVSHGQAMLVASLLSDLLDRDHPEFKIILTINIPEDEESLERFLPFIKIIRNRTPKGFGANHNFAFLNSNSDFFVVLNPDIRFSKFDWNNLLCQFKDTTIGICAPLVLSSCGSIEDSARLYPTTLRILKRIFSRKNIPDYFFLESPLLVDWVAGMFVVFRSVAFSTVKGFDEGYFMYVEDADICLRMRHHGWCSVLNPSSIVIHDAQRASRRSIKYFIWHIYSLFRFLFMPFKAPQSSIN